MARGMLAAVAGYGVFAVSAVLLFTITGQDPHTPAAATYVGLSALYALVFAALGGYVAAVLSRDRALRWSVAVFVLMSAGAIASLIARPGDGTVWSQTVGLAASPAAVLGGLFAKRGSTTAAPRTTSAR